MKNLFLILCITSLFATASTAKAAPSLSPEAIALALINEASADSWSENGDVEQLNFTHLKCNLDSGKCELSYKLKYYKENAKQLHCELSKINGYNDLIDVVKYGFVLHNGIYEQVDTCMNK